VLTEKSYKNKNFIVAKCFMEVFFFM